MQNNCMDNKILAQRLKTQRELRGFTQKELAAAVGITERGYQGYEAVNRFRTPSLSMLFGIAEKLDVSIDYLLGRTENPEAHTN